MKLMPFLKWTGVSLRLTGGHTQDDVFGQRAYDANMSSMKCSATSRANSLVNSADLFNNGILVYSVTAANNEAGSAADVAAVLRRRPGNLRVFFVFRQRYPY